MRVGILTYHWVCNFGAQLQTLSTCRNLASLGHSPRVLNYRPPDKCARYRSLVPGEQWRMHDRFCAEYLPQTEVCQDEGDLIRICEADSLDGIILGSDAVLRLNRDARHSDASFPNPMWLTWTQRSTLLRDIPLAMLSASTMGSFYNRLPHGIRTAISASISRFAYVSVRDSWSECMIKYVTEGGCRPDVAPDPVFALNPALPSFKRAPVLDELITEGRKYVLISLSPSRMRQRWVQALVKEAHRRGLMVVSLPMPEGYACVRIDYQIPMPLSPLEWQDWIKHAAAYIGERFHALVVALHNSVPFFVIDTYTGKGMVFLRSRSKIFDLCKDSGTLEYRANRMVFRCMSPRAILARIDGFPRQEAMAYAENARNDFMATLSTIVMTFAGRVPANAT